MEIKAYKRGTLTGYWKNETWEQPALTSNIDSPLMQVSASNEGRGSAYNALDGNTDTGWATANNVTSATLTIKLSEIIHITKIEVLGLTNQYGHTSTVTINGEQKSFDYVTSSTVFFEYDDYATKEIVLNVTGVTWCTIRDIQITATKIIEGTPEDYDFTTQENKYFAFKANVRKYYKYQYSTFTRPNLTAEGALGGGSFSVQTNGYVSGYQTYKAVDGNNSTGWECFNYANDAYIFYNPMPLKLTSIKMRNWTGSGRKDATKGGKVYGSNNGEDWTELVTYTNSDYSSGGEWYISMTSVSSTYRYYKITCTDGTSDAGSYWNIAEITPIGSVQTIVEGAPEDYDFYKDEDVYSAFNI